MVREEGTGRAREKETKTENGFNGGERKRERVGRERDEGRERKQRRKKK